MYMYELGLSQVGLPQSGVAVTVTATVAGKTAARAIHEQLRGR